NLTEPQAGSDLAQVRTKAVPQADGTYRVFGQKIYITYGEHDLADNIIHLVLARTPNAPEGVKGISLFIVPKFLVNDDGSNGTRNDVWCASLEHKLGIKASPTAVLIYGDGKFAVDGQAGAVGYLLGEENRGLETMFIMMNAARFGVGLQGIGIAERAYQKAVQYARERVQSRDLAGSAGPVAIVHHPDVKRMLMTMRAQTEAARALAYWAASRRDIAHASTNPNEAREAQAFYEYLVPIIKGWSTELAIDVASLGVQVHGGMGFIEETGAAQFYRDARILTIYEGTTAIQANDLVGRKTARDGGLAAKALIALVEQTEAELARCTHADAKVVLEHLTHARQALLDVIDFVVAQYRSNVKSVFAGSVPYLKLAGIVLGGWQMARALLAAHAHLNAGENDRFYATKIATATFYAQHFLSQASGMRRAIVEGGATFPELDEAVF
ncbi:MAG TPA: acyl-CoA dehydrogenase, partial [Burkholderiaceae bacterium]|nr:acyl-CoA dehydrogenase [Burkholderiaceae bacterium]